MQKPSYTEWAHWAQVAIDRLTTSVHVYKKPPHLDAYLPEQTSQQKAAKLVALLHQLHKTADIYDELSSQTPNEENTHGALLVSELQPLFQDLLNELPDLSSDMQHLLKSAWCDDCNGKLATELFRGPAQHENEGIGSGMPAHGRLPEALQNLLEAEELGDQRAPSDIIARRSGSHTLQNRQNGSFLRSAGRVD